jgi:hypothetical protein
VDQHFNRMANLHLKDSPAPRRGSQRCEYPRVGKGDAPIKEVLRLMKQRRAPFPACIEYEYNGKGTAVQEVQKCLDYARAALES